MLWTGVSNSARLKTASVMHSSLRIMNFNSSRFPMTTDLFVKFISGFSALSVVVMLAVQFFVVAKYVPIPRAQWLFAGVTVVTLATLGLTVLLAPRAVRLSGGRLIVERLAWPDFSVPIRQLSSVGAGPELKLVTGEVRRVAGNGGLMGFTGLFHVKNVGVVRCWATQLQTPTVLVHRTEGRPLLLGVDDAAALRAALVRAGVPVSS